MNIRLVGLGALTLALAGGATAFALIQSSRGPAVPATAVNTGRTVAADDDVDDDDDGDDNEDVITLADLPESVRTALVGITPDSAVTQVVRETERDSTTYDVEYTKEGARWAVEFSADGAVLENELDGEDDND